MGFSQYVHQAPTQCWKQIPDAAGYDPVMGPRHTHKHPNHKEKGVKCTCSVPREHKGGQELKGDLQEQGKFRLRMKELNLEERDFEMNVPVLRARMRANLWVCVH